MKSEGNHVQQKNQAASKHKLYNPLLLMVYTMHISIP